MIKKANIEDADTLAGLAIQMWKDNEPEGLAEEFRKLVKN